MALEVTKSIIKSAEFDDRTPVRRHRADYIIVLCMGLLMLLGLIIMYAIGSQRANVLNNAYGSDYSSSYFFIKQVISLVIALGAFLLTANISYTKLTKHSGKILLIAFGLCILLAIAGFLGLGIAQKTLGATRWFNLGFLGSFQPSEFLKFALLIFLGGFLGTRARQQKMNNFKETLLPLTIITGLALLFVVVIQKDLGTGVSILGIILSMLYVGGIKGKILLVIGVLALVVGSLFVISEPHRIERVTTFLQGDSITTTDSDDSNYQVEHAKLAIGTGGLFGVGIGNSVQATGYLPEAINDSVFAIMGETFGFIGLIVILAIFTILMLRLLKLTDGLADMRLKLLAAGVFGWFGTHVILNVASMIGVFPLTGITLPLLSFGGTSMLFIAAALGLAFQLSRYTVHPDKIKEAQNESSSSRRGVGRTRYANRGSFTRN